jgi:hypothetical protein
VSSGASPLRRCSSLRESASGCSSARPGIAERRDLETRLQRTRALIAAGEATAGRLSEFMREVMQLEMDLELLKPVLPTELDIPGF